ncbi:MAG TPA: hypothetical protein VGN59_08040 [Acidimicrobiia bacterium]|jgi:hypothetical protein
MTEMVVIPMSSGEYVLQFQDGDHVTDHRVDLSKEMLTELGRSPDDAREVIRASIQLLMEDGDGTPLAPSVDLGSRWGGDRGFREQLTDRLRA